MEGDFPLKVVFTGESNVGKTTLINWESQSVFLVPPTLGLQFKKKAYKIDGKLVQVMLWDRVGSQRFQSIKSPLYRNSHAICVCFSLNERQSFERLPIWTNNLRLNEVECPLFLIGCKADLQHVITDEEIKQFAFKEGMTYFQTSVKLDLGVTNNMQMIMEAAYHYYLKNPIVRLKVETEPSQHDKFNGFCWT